MAPADTRHQGVDVEAINARGHAKFVDDIT
jgi:hypothetical protein